MIRNERIRIGLRTMRYNVTERFYDLVNITVPIFLVMGILVACFRFWTWLFGVACFQ